jgi:hypothetical protein
MAEKKSVVKLVASASAEKRELRPTTAVIGGSLTPLAVTGPETVK